MFERILVAVDSAPTRMSAIELAGGLARLTNAEIKVLHIITTAVSGNASVTTEDDATARGVLEETLSVLRGMDVKAEGELMRGLTTQVAQAVSTAAEQFGADLLVVSPHHRGSLAALFNPRVSDAVAHASRIPVLLAPTDDTSRKG
ncbi:universal stress protein [Streptomyces sp. NPDC006654]|uniref:universal stress protein n=1 Tax=Streptomyces sp. NPDC006654 TaxID=3156897 RepID=UPI0033DE08AB